MSYSLIVRTNNRLEVLPGDYEGLNTDGIRPLRCVSVHDSWEAAEDARKCHQLADAAD